MTKNFLWGELAAAVDYAEECQLTDDIVAVLVTHQADKGGITPIIDTGQSVDDLSTLRLLPKLNALLHDVTGKLVFRVSEQLADDNIDHARPILLFAILDDMLNHVVTKLVGNEFGGARVQFGQDGFAIGLLTVLQHALNDAASVWVGRQFLHLTLEGIDDELHIFGRYSLNGLLNHMVTILISYTLENTRLKLFDHGSLLISQDVFEGLWRDVLATINQRNAMTPKLTFCTTRHPYIWVERERICPFI